MEPTLEQCLMAAVFMVGNMDTEEDKARWWKSYGKLWQIVASTPNVQEWANTVADEAE